MTAAIDNDLLYKGAWYGLLRELIGAVPSSSAEAYVLGQARFVIVKKLEKQQQKYGAQATLALAHLKAILAELPVAEPTEQEQNLAADLEHLAQQQGLALDGGESLLCAITTIRGLDYLATGDKRAIASLGQLITTQPSLQALSGKIVCLEQLVMRLLIQGKTGLREAICAQRHVDVALAMCFSCSNPAATVTSWTEGLTSYINSVRASAPTLTADT